MIIDFHSHILPGIDDGSADVQESIAMLRMEAEQGITHVIATPHFYAHSDSPGHFLAKREKAEILLREEMAKQEGLPQVSIGAEVYYFPGISDSEIISQLTINGESYILLEMPQSPWTDRMYREMADIRKKQGIIPIIAHVDRYISPFRTHHIPERLAELPVLVQANASFFLRGSTRRMALKMLKKNQIHLLGSDCHNMRNRPPMLGPALEQIRKNLGDAAIERVVQFQQNVFGNPI